MIFLVIITVGLLGLAIGKLWGGCEAETRIERDCDIQGRFRIGMKTYTAKQESLRSKLPPPPKQKHDEDKT